MPSTLRYLLISPCRDEAAYLRRSIESVLQQTHLPALWIIVDDGSTDGTPRILEEYARRHPWITVLTRTDRSVRSVGPGVVDAFYAGFDSVDANEFDLVCKHDLDLDLPPSYFEVLIRRMEENPRIGTCSGKPYFHHPATGVLTSERCGDETSVGMTKLYRLECFREIGGFVREVMWDGIDCHRCRMGGWIACSWDEPELRFIHLRPMGSSQGSILQGRMRHGFGQYFMGTGIVYMTASSLCRMMHPPRLLGGAAMLWGYVKSWIKRLPRYQDHQFVRFLRAYQRACLLRGKRRATLSQDARGNEIWRTTHPDRDTNTTARA